MSTRRFDRLRIDQLGPFTFERMAFLIENSRDIEAKDANRFRIGQGTDEFSCMMNLTWPDEVLKERMVWIRDDLL